MTRITVPVCTAVAKVMHPATGLYSFGFENGTADSWTNLTAGENIDLNNVHTGTWLGVMPVASGTTTSSRSISGLTVGRQYVFAAWTAGWTTQAGLHSVGVSGIGSSSPVTAYFEKYRKIHYRFTATATSHTFNLIKSSATSIGGYWDDISLTELEYEVDSFDVDIKGGSTITLDERSAPFVQARLNVALPDESDLALLDTRTANSVRLLVTTSQSFIRPAAAPQTRTFDLLLHERSADHATSSEATLVCHSDEAKLIDSGNATATVDSALKRDHKSLRAIISTILAKYAAVLEPGTADADFTITTALTNLVPNPSAETNFGSFVTTGSATSTLSRNSTTGIWGSYAFTVTASSSGSAGLGVGTGSLGSGANAVISVQEGKKYWASVYVSASTARSGTLNIRFFDAANATIGSDVTSPTIGPFGPIGTTGYVRPTLSATAPAGAVKATVFFTASSMTSGNILYTDGWMFVQSDDPTSPPYFDGSFGTDTYYSYAWSGTANASTSRRIRLDNRDPKLLTREPGELDFDVAHQLVQVAGLRLFCDEQRRWYLVDPATYTVPGTVTMDNPSRGSDRISREAGDWADAVVVTYRWIGTDGSTQVAWDASSSGGTLIHNVTWDRPYPGPGAAAAVLARFEGRGRVQELDGPPDLSATPAMALETTLPDTPDQEGYISKVQFGISTEGITMRVTARDLEDA